MPKLYTNETSPTARSVLLTAAALNLNVERVIIDMYGLKEHLKPEFIKMNPQHTIPTLLDDDGTSVWDSHVIMSYLVGKYGKTDDLYPKDVRKRAVVDQRLYFESDKLFGNIQKIFGPIRTKKADKISDESIETMNNIYDFLNTFIGNNNYVAGNSLTIADFSLITTTLWIHQVIPIDAKYANVHRWIKTMEKLPYYNIIEEGLAKGKAFIEALGLKF